MAIAIKYSAVVTVAAATATAAIAATAATAATAAIAIVATAAGSRVQTAPVTTLASPQQLLQKLLILPLWHLLS